MKKLFLFLVIIAATSLPGCTKERLHAPVLAWVFYPDSAIQPYAVTASLSGTGDGGILDVTWAFDPCRSDPRTEPGAKPGTKVDEVLVTVVFLAEGNPNWKPLVVRDKEALINHMVRPEADYLATGGDPAMVGLARALLDSYAPGLPLGAIYVTFVYPAEVPGVVREAGTLTIHHTLQQLGGAGSPRRWVLGCTPGSTWAGAVTGTVGGTKPDGTQDKRPDGPATVEAPGLLLTDGLVGKTISTGLGTCIELQKRPLSSGLVAGAISLAIAAAAFSSLCLRKRKWRLPPGWPWTFRENAT